MSELLLNEANELLRSAYQIAKREGEATNWSAFKDLVEAALLKQAGVNGGSQEAWRSTCTERGFRLLSFADVKFNTKKTAVVSTRYVSDDVDALEDFSERSRKDERLPRIEDHQHGWFVFVTSDRDVLMSQLIAMRECAFSLRFRDIYVVAHKQSIHLINFDAHGEDYEELEAKPIEKPKPLKPQMIREGTADDDPDKAVPSDSETSDAGDKENG